MAFVQKTDFELVASGFEYPEGPVYEPDGSILLVEIRGECLTRVRPDGSKEKVAEIKGGPNGAAFGPDGHLYIANSGGFDWLDVPLGKQTISIGTTQPKSYEGGRIERLSLDDGKLETLFRSCSLGYDNSGFQEREPKPVHFPEPVTLRGPDDLVFDKSGGYWITDFGKQRPRDADVTGLFYVSADGEISEKVFPLAAPNGVALSPQEDRVYVALTYTREVVYWELDGAGKIKPNPETMDGTYLLTAKLPGQSILDSMKVDEDGNVYVAVMLPNGNTPLSNGGIAVISPDGKNIDFMEISVPGQFAPLPSNLCFGGPDRKTLYVTCGASGLLLKAQVHVPGLPLNYNPY